MRSPEVTLPFPVLRCRVAEETGMDISPAFPWETLVFNSYLSVYMETVTELYAIMNLFPLKTTISRDVSFTEITSRIIDFKGRFIR